jgi:CheY-specific phosphatase CheX
MAAPEARALESLVDVVSRVLAEVLETMFFAEAVAADCAHDWLSSAVGARIGFAGSHLGELRLSVSRDAADSIACAFLGLEPLEITEPLCSQVILELTNILCGDILSHLWPESKLALGPPELSAEEPAVEGALHRCFELPEGKLALWIRWSEVTG